jgi:hypothetical protein
MNAAPAAAATCGPAKSLKIPAHEVGALQAWQALSGCRCWSEAQARQDVAVVASDRLALETERNASCAGQSSRPWRSAPEDAFFSR